MVYLTSVACLVAGLLHLTEALPGFQARVESVRVDAEQWKAGPLYARIGDTEKRIADDAVRAWLVEDGRNLVYSGKDGSGGYENEGQSLRIYDSATGAVRKIMSEYYVIDRVTAVRTTTGKLALLVEMRDGGLGASHLAVVDPSRGEVFSKSKVKLMESNSRQIVIGYFREQDWEPLNRGENIRPSKTERFTLDTLLGRSVVTNPRRPR